MDGFRTARWRRHVASRCVHVAAAASGRATQDRAAATIRDVAEYHAGETRATQPPGNASRRECGSAVRPCLDGEDAFGAPGRDESVPLVASKTCSRRGSKLTRTSSPGWARSPDGSVPSRPARQGEDRQLSRRRVAPSRRRSPRHLRSGHDLNILRSDAEHAGAPSTMCRRQRLSPAPGTENSGCTTRTAPFDVSNVHGMKFIGGLPTTVA